MRASIASFLVLALALLAGCDTFPRSLTYSTVPSTAMRGVRMEYAVHVPADLRDDEHLPLVIFLHGGGDGPDCFDRHGVAAELRTAMANGTVPRAVIVLPEGDLGFWANWYDGSRRYEDYVVDELAPRVARAYHTAECGTGDDATTSGCHLMGVSMGAEGTIRFAVHRPGTFRSITAISGPAMDTERRIAFVSDPVNNIMFPAWHVFGPPRPRARIEADDPYLVWNDAAALHGARLALAWGSHDRDDVRTGSMALSASLDRHGVPHTHEEFDGQHGWEWWRPLILRLLAAQLADTHS